MSRAAPLQAPAAPYFPAPNARQRHEDPRRARHRDGDPLCRRHPRRRPGDQPAGQLAHHARLQQVDAQPALPPRPLPQRPRQATCAPRPLAASNRKLRATRSRRARSRSARRSTWSVAPRPETCTGSSPTTPRRGNSATRRSCRPASTTSRPRPTTASSISPVATSTAKTRPPTSGSTTRRRRNG